jgi:hypothetical protein
VFSRNPSAAASLALLVLKGLRFAPALYVAGVISDGLVGHFPLGIKPTLASELIVAIAYSRVAAALRHFAHADQGFPRADRRETQAATAATKVNSAGSPIKSLAPPWAVHIRLLGD